MLMLLKESIHLLEYFTYMYCFIKSYFSQGVANSLALIKNRSGKSISSTPFRSFRSQRSSHGLGFNFTLIGFTGIGAPAIFLFLQAPKL